MANKYNSFDNVFLVDAHVETRPTPLWLMEKFKKLTTYFIIQIYYYKCFILILFWLKNT